MAFMALQGVWGAVTDLAREFMVSRTFIYTLRCDLQAIAEKIFGECGTSLEQKEQWIRKQAIAAALCLRLEGRCSIGSTSQRECIERSGYLAVYLVNDEGKSMLLAQKKVLSQVIRQSDTFHGLAHRLGAWVDRLEKTAYTAIERKEDRLDRLQSAKSEAVIEKKTKEYETAKEQADKAIESYDRFHYLYLYLIGTLQIFDWDGNPNERQAGEATVYAALDLLSELNNGSIDKKVKTIRRLVLELFWYLDEAARIVKELKNSAEIPQDALRALCIARQYQKSWIKAKQAERRKEYKSREREEPELLEDELGDRFQEVKGAVYLELDNIVQSSAMVENINSILRMYLNTTKNHVTQGMLNLFMHYHNHRRYAAGKRKGKTQDKDWLELLIEKVPWEQSSQLKPAA